MNETKKPQTYTIRIDKEQYEVSEATMTGRQLLTLAGKTPVEQYTIYEKKRGQTIPLGLDAVADLTEPGRDRFVTLPLDQTEGGA